MFRSCRPLVASIAVLLCAGGASSQAPDRVIWIAIDSLRAENLHYMGYARETSPWLDQLSARSVNFRWTISPSNVTRQSVAAYFTGRHFSVLQAAPVVDRSARLFTPMHGASADITLPESAETLAETLQAAGFRTYLWSANILVQDVWGFAQGFDEFIYLQRYGRVKPSIEDISEDIRKTYRRGKSKEFIYIHTMDVHMPYRPPLEYERMFVRRANKRGVVQEGTIHDKDNSRVEAISSRPYYAEGHSADWMDYALLHDLYDGEIRWTDSQLPFLLEALNHDPERDLLIISSDHGEQFLEHGFWGHGFSSLGHDVHVPLLLYWHGFAPAAYDDPVSLMDLFPTLCDLYQLPKPRGMMGTSLLPVLRGQTLPSHPVYTEMPDNVGPGAAVIADGYWYWLQTDMYYIRPGTAWPFLEGLYEYADDPTHRRNLVYTHMETANRMNALLSELNPRWAPFSPDAIRRTDSPPRFGPNLLTKPRPNTNVVDNTRGVNSRRTWTITMPDASLKFYVSTDGPDLAHLFEATYLMEDSELVFEMLDREKGELFWAHTRRHSRTQAMKIRAMVRPKTQRFEFRVRASGTGKVKLFDLSLRRAHVPELRVAPSGSEAAPAVRVEELDSDAIERLRGLGYTR